MSRRRMIPVIPSLLVFATLAWSQTSPGGALTLDDCLRIALTEHPLLEASHHRFEASRARIVQAGAIPQPIFELDSDLQPQPFHFPGSGESYVGFSQLIEFPGRRALRRSVAERESDAALADVDVAKLETRFAVRQAFYALLHAEERLRLAQQDLDLATAFLKTTETRLGAGDIPRVEVIRARVEAAQAANTVRAATTAVRLARAALNVNLGREQASPLEIRGELRLPPQALSAADLQRAALGSRPELKRLAAAIDAETLKRTQAKQSYYPDVEVGVSRHRLEGEASTWDVTLSVPVPLFHQPLKGRLAEAEANIAALRRELDAARYAIGLEVEEARAEAEAARDQIRVFEDGILKDAEEAYDMLQFSFVQGEIGGLDLISARRTLVTARLGYADALYSHAVALAAVDRAIGQ